MKKSLRLIKFLSLPLLGVAKLYVFPLLTLYMTEVTEITVPDSVVVTETRRAKIHRLYPSDEHTIVDSLRDCSNINHVFMPELANTAADSDDKLFWDEFGPQVASFSMVARGTTPGGAPVMVYSHKEHYFSSNLEKGLSLGPGFAKDRRDYRWVGSLPQEEFERMRKQADDISVFEVSIENALHWPNGEYGIDEPTLDHSEMFDGEIQGKPTLAINHPFTVPLFGSEEIARKYLAFVSGMTLNDPTTAKIDWNRKNTRLVQKSGQWVDENLAVPYGMLLCLGKPSVKNHWFNDGYTRHRVVDINTTVGFDLYHNFVYLEKTKPSKQA